MRSIFTLFIILVLQACSMQEVSMVTETQESEVVFGIDISQYQGKICWETLSTQKKHPVEFVIMRATMGKDRVDKKFKKNWRQAREKEYILGAYHYYDPNEYSIDQANNYLKVVRKKLEPGDFIPILDIEDTATIQNMDRLRLGVRRWLEVVEKEYGVKPIIYTAYSFWKDHLVQEFSEYPLWIAAYSESRRLDSLVINSHIHQFTEKVVMPGITANTVDGNDIKRERLTTLLLR